MDLRRTVVETKLATIRTRLVVHRVVQINPDVLAELILFRMDAEEHAEDVNLVTHTAILALPDIQHHHLHALTDITQLIKNVLAELQAVRNVINVNLQAVPAEVPAEVPADQRLQTHGIMSEQIVVILFAGNV